jgi:putative YhbY family RNA-binding protein
MRTLTPAQRRALRAKAHHLHAFASIGHGGLTPSVLHEIDISLRAHELVKIRVFAAERDDREAMLARICDALDAAPVQHLGKVLIVWRPAPEEEVAPASARSKSAAKRQPQARRPRSPLPRMPSRPAPAAPPPPRGKGRRGTARHVAPGSRDAVDLGAGFAPSARRKSTFTPKTTPRSFSAKPNPRSAWEKKTPAPRGARPLGAKPRDTRSVTAESAGGTRRRRKSP